MEENQENQEMNKACEDEKACSTNDKKCKCGKLKCIVTLLTLIFSLTAMIFAILVHMELNVFFKAIKIDIKAQAIQQLQQPADFLISKKYDKGQSFEKAKAENKPILVFFYVDWCGYCKRFAPIYAKLLKDKDIKEAFATAYVNCEAPENMDLVKEYEIQGFPSVFVVKGNEKIKIQNDILYEDEKKLKEEVLSKK